MWALMLCRAPALSPPNSMRPRSRCPGQHGQLQHGVLISDRDPLRLANRNGRRRRQQFRPRTSLTIRSLSRSICQGMVRAACPRGGLGLHYLSSEKRQHSPATFKPGLRSDQRSSARVRMLQGAIGTRRFVLYGNTVNCLVLPFSIPHSPPHAALGEAWFFP